MESVRKLRWTNALLEDETKYFPTLTLVELFPDGKTFLYWAGISYDMSTDSYRYSYFSRDRKIIFPDDYCKTIQETITTVEQLLFEEGIRDGE